MIHCFGMKPITPTAHTIIRVRDCSGYWFHWPAMPTGDKFDRDERYKPPSPTKPRTRRA
jgi:hypothetical protein